MFLLVPGIIFIFWGFPIYLRTGTNPLVALKFYKTFEFRIYHKIHFVKTNLLNNQFYEIGYQFSAEILLLLIVLWLGG